MRPPKSSRLAVDAPVKPRMLDFLARPMNAELEAHPTHNELRLRPPYLIDLARAPDLPSALDGKKVKLNLGELDCWYSRRRACLTYVDF